MQPLLSIFCPTYNHEKFISKAIEGFLFQRTTFNVEIIIHDDASTDKTVEIIKNFEVQNSDKIRCINQKINQLSKDKAILTKTMFSECTGKYIAICEGDDYWTDPLKLQKQVDFLEANEDFAICHHNMQIIYEEDAEKNRLSNPSNQKEITTIEDLAKGNYIYTASCVFRKYDYELPDWFNKSPVGDYVLHLLNARFGKIRYFNEVMGIYRVHKGGIWEQNSIQFRQKKWLAVLNLLIGEFESPINEILIKQQAQIIKNLVKSGGLITDFPECLNYLIQENLSIEDTNCELNKKLQNLKNSKSYKLGNFILKPFRFLKKILKRGNTDK